ncbi:MAG: bifunctional folylpolyglutamate synthase/dihydrofolate synthase [Oscillospiraceae bacterium]|nr:bifunctional folylpolyglutamate synthase/dihydrofolate synthase [Oscillospiraceae bacterium]
MDIKETMNYLNSFSKLGKPVKNLLRFAKIMRALGNPQEKLKFVHVAGTNGKGSTVRMIAGALTKAGYKTGEFTSPYIYVYNDRIRIDGVNISDSELTEIVTLMKPIIDGLDTECSQFEITTAIAFLYFAAKKCDIVVLEAGLGGLLDCTNVIDECCASVITSISLDHTAILGNTVAEIAQQKAGIIKAECPVILAASQQRESYDVVYEKAMELGSSFVTPNIERLRIEQCDYSGNRFVYKDMTYATTMVGRHQIDNALTAVETLNILKKNGFDKLTYVHVYDGIKSAQVPSRCQIIRKDKPLVMIDGAHNPDGMRALAEFIKTVPKSPKILVCGMMEDKDWHTAVNHIAKYINKAVCVEGFAPKTVTAEKLATIFDDGITSDIENAVSKAIKLAGPDGMVIVAGSLYLASAIHDYNKL